jgi:hypothetical protein
MATLSALQRILRARNTVLPPTRQPKSVQMQAGLVQQAQQNPQSLTPPDVLQLQRMVGNHKTTEMLGRNEPAQQNYARFHLGSTSDNAERAAERSAQQATPDAKSHAEARRLACSGRNSCMGRRGARLIHRSSRRSSRRAAADNPSPKGCALPWSRVLAPTFKVCASMPMPAQIA